MSPMPSSRGSYRLRRYMKSKGLSRVAFAAMLKVHPNTVSKWLRGSIPQARHLIALKAATGIAMRDWMEPDGSEDDDGPRAAA